MEKTEKIHMLKISGEGESKNKDQEVVLYYWMVKFKINGYWFLASINRKLGQTHEIRYIVQLGKNEEWLTDDFGSFRPDDFLEERRVG